MPDDVLPSGGRSPTSDICFSYLEWISIGLLPRAVGEWRIEASTRPWPAAGGGGCGTGEGKTQALEVVQLSSCVAPSILCSSLTVLRKCLSFGTALWSGTLSLSPKLLGWVPLGQLLNLSEYHFRPRALSASVSNNEVQLSNLQEDMALYVRKVGRNAIIG